MVYFTSKKMQVIAYLKKYPFTIISILIILYLSFMSVGGIPDNKFFQFRRPDLVVHFLMYSFLSVVFFSERYKNIRNENIKLVWKILLGLISFGATIEIFQPILSNRSCEFFDFVANILGIFAGFLTHRLWVKILKR